MTKAVPYSCRLLIVTQSSSSLSKKAGLTLSQRRPTLSSIIILSSSYFSSGPLSFFLYFKKRTIPIEIFQIIPAGLQINLTGLCNSTCFLYINITIKETFLKGTQFLPLKETNSRRHHITSLLRIILHDHVTPLYFCIIGQNNNNNNIKKTWTSHHL